MSIGKYKDIISYELAEGVSEDQLLKVAKQIVEGWMKDLPGFIHWEIHRLKDGSYADIVYWQSAADAQNAEREMTNIPNAADWFACYKPGSINSKNMSLLASFS